MSEHQQPETANSTSHLLSSIELQNTHWLIQDATRFSIFLSRLGPQKVADLRSLRICPHATYKKTGQDWLDKSVDGWSSGPEWCKLLNKLGDEATGLSYVYVLLDCYEEGLHFGAGRDASFVKALGRLKVSGKMELVGMFAKGWPEYLEKKIGMPVWDCQKERDMKRLREYQRCAEGQIS